MTVTLNPNNKTLASLHLANERMDAIWGLFREMQPEGYAWWGIDMLMDGATAASWGQAVLDALGPIGTVAGEPHDGRKNYPHCRVRYRVERDPDLRMDRIYIPTLAENGLEMKEDTKWLAGDLRQIATFMVRSNGFEVLSGIVERQDRPVESRLIISKAQG